MKPSDYFRSAVKAHLKTIPRGGQKILAEESGLTPRHLNDFLGGRRAMTEDDQIKITDHIGVDYLDFLQIGKELITGETPSTEKTQQVISLEDKPIKVTNNFQNQEIALEINTDLLAIEKIDPDELEEIRDNIKSKLKKLTKKIDRQKKKPAANEDK